MSFCCTLWMRSGLMARMLLSVSRQIEIVLPSMSTLPRTQLFVLGHRPATAISIEAGSLQCAGVDTFLHKEKSYEKMRRL